MADPIADLALKKLAKALEEIAAVIDGLRAGSMAPDVASTALKEPRTRLTRTINLLAPEKE